MGMERFFYQSGRLASVSGPHAVSLIHGAGRALAKSKLGDAYLFAGDDSNSVRKEVGPQGHLRVVAYTPYGYSNEISGGDDGLVRFNGERNDVFSARYMLGNGTRSYSPVLMRFCSSDKLSPFGAGGLNSYAYCKNDPVNYVDPTGHMLKAKLNTPANMPEMYLKAVRPLMEISSEPMRKTLAVSVVKTSVNFYLDATKGMSPVEFGKFFESQPVKDQLVKGGLAHSYMEGMVSSKRVLNLSKKVTTESMGDVQKRLDAFIAAGENTAGMRAQDFKDFSKEVVSVRSWRTGSGYTDWLNDIDLANMRGQAGVDYQIYVRRASNLLLRDIFGG